MERYVIQSDSGAPLIKFESLLHAKQFQQEHRKYSIRDLYLIDMKTGERITP